MLKKALITGLLAPLFLIAREARAEGGALPVLQVKPWEGYFVAHETRAFQFGLNCDGSGVLTLNNRRGNTVPGHPVRIDLTIEEVLPNGKVVVKRIIPESLATKDKPTTKPKAVKYTGKVTGDAAFEARIEFSGARMFFGGRVTDPGKLKNPLRFVVRVQVPALYRGADPKDREFKRKVKDDEVRFKTLGGKRGKIEMGEVVDLAKKCGEEGLSTVRFESGAYDGRRLEFSCVKGGAIELDHPEGKPLTGGMTIAWRPDPKKDADAEARLELAVR